ncbi:UDP-4-amino-4,6-dideoxy-N-acetyl-beta-L-altrosamine N-acetyltransferase [Pseudomonas caricapapayae]|uniref:UDP-4-amino-4, 6-dideoxy-N-acetyl-beta-L-altrosamine N-acetyltransferase n=1 Tax=Pseudomonas caricapapayae TaxID=46678 RepID=A0ACC7M0D5_9PSED
MALRTLSENDLFLILNWRNAPAVRMSMYSTNEISDEEHRAWFARMQTNQTSLWYLYENEQGHPDGVVYFTNLQEKNRSAFWGFYTNPFALPGTGTKLGRDAMNEAFSVKHLHKLNSEVLISNTKSIKLHHRLGFRQEGLFKDHHLTDSGYIDVVRLGMLSSEWLDTRASVDSYIAQFNTPLASDQGR